MIGLGKYSANIKNLLYRGEATFEISDDNGNYKIALDLTNADFDFDKIITKEAKEDGNKLTAVLETSIFPGKDVDLELTFDGDTCNGFLKVPFVGKIKIDNAKKIS